MKLKAMLDSDSLTSFDVGNEYMNTFIQLRIYIVYSMPEVVLFYLNEILTYI